MLRRSATLHQEIEVPAVKSAILCACHTRPHEPTSSASPYVHTFLFFTLYTSALSLKNTASVKHYNVKEP